MRRVVAGIVVLLLLGFGLLFFPPVADHFGYARPVPHGLPARYSMFGIQFQAMPGCIIPLKGRRCTAVRGLNRSLPPCPTLKYLREHQYWPLQEIGSVPTLLGHGHPVYNILAAWSGSPPYGLFLVRDGSCYLPYHQAPGY
jgi:hypothetical protein